MAQIGLWATIKEWIGGVGFAIYLWSQSLTVDEYFDLLDRDAEHRRGADAPKQDLACLCEQWEFTYHPRIHNENCPVHRDAKS